MSWHKKDWLTALLGVGGALTGAGMFGLGPLASLMGGGEAAAGAGAAGAAGAEGAGVGTSGMFAQVPGVTSGSQQAAMLAEQNAGLGGAANDLTAKAAMDAVNAGRASGQIGFPQMLAERAKFELAGLNDPSVLGQRAMTNLGRMGANVGKGMAANATMSLLMPQQQGYQPVMPRPMGAPQQAQGGGALTADDFQQLSTLLPAAKSGDLAAKQQLAALARRLGVDPATLGL